MTNDIKKGDRPTAQVYSLFHSSRATQIQKDLGPNGGDNPGNAIQDNAFESEDEFQQLYVGATRDQGIIQPPYNLLSLLTKPVSDQVGSLDRTAPQRYCWEYLSLSASMILYELIHHY